MKIALCSFVPLARKTRLPAGSETRSAQFRRHIFVPGVADWGIESRHGRLFVIVDWFRWR